MSSFFKSSGSVDTETLPQSGSNVASNTETNTAVSSFFKTSGANSTDEATIQSSVDAAAASATAAANSATSASDSATAAANSAAASSTFTTGGGSVGGDVSITGSLSITGSVDGRDVATDGTKLDGIEAGATADQTDAEIKTAYENNSDTNAFTDALQTKLAGIETGATADQSAAEIRTLVDSATDSNVFTDADHTKLDGIETGADVTDTTNVVAALTAGTNVTIAADGTISSIDTDTTYSNATTSAAGLMSATDKTKLDGVETGATADQTASEIKSAYESNTDTNAFTDADHTKLDGIEANADVTDTTNVVAALTAGTNVTIGADGTISSTDTDTTYSNATTSVAGLMSASDKTKIDGIESGATADQSASEILTAIKTVDGAASGLDADLLDGQHGSYYTGYTDTAVANLVDSAPAALDTLNELAAALGDDANFSTTVTNSIATKLPLAGGTMTGNIVMSGAQTVDGRDLSVDGAKLDGIESGATADQTAAEIRTLVESATDSNVFTDADHTKLNGIEAGADVTDTANVTAAGALMDSEVTNLADVKSFDPADYATAAQGTTADAALPKAGGQMTGNITFSGSQTVDGRDLSADGTKLDGIESGATADQTKADIDALNIDAATLDSLDSTQFLRSDAADSFSQQIDGTTIELAGGVTYDPPGSSGIDTATDVGLALHSGARVVMGTSGFIRTIIDATASQALQFGQSATGYFAGSEIYGGSQGVKLFYNTSSKLQTLTGGVSVTGDITVSGTVDGRDVAADGTKLDGIEAGADVTDSTNVNNAGAAIFSTTPPFVITDGTSGQVLTTNGSGVLSFTTVSGGGGISNVVEDTTPQLGGDLQSNGNDIDLADNDKLIAGTGGDLEVYSDGTDGYIDFVGADGETLFIRNTTATTNSTDGVVIETRASLPHYVHLTNNAGINLGVFGSDKVSIIGSGSYFNHDIILNNTSSELRFRNGSNYVTLDAVSATTDTTVTLPNATGTVPVFSTAPTSAITDGTNGQVLTTDGSGGLSFTDGSGVPSTGGTFTGDVTITSSGTNQSANLMLNNTDTSNNFGKAIEAYRSGIGTGQRQQIMLGKDGSTNDTATLNFYYAGDASSSNRFEVGFWGADSLLNVLANGNVGIGETNPSHKLAVAGDINLTGDLSVGGSVSLTGGGELVVNNGEGITNSKIQVFKQNYFSPNGLDPGEYIELVSITPTSFVSGSHRQFDITGKIIAQSEDSSSAIDVNVRIGLSGFGTFDNTDITYTTTQDADWIEPVLWVNSSTDTVKLLVKAKTQPSGKSGDIDHLTADLTLVRDLNSSTITWNTTVDPTDITAIASGYTETVGKKTIVTIPDGAVELYHNDSKKLETTSTGASVTGELDVSGLLDVEGDIDFEGALVEKAYNLTGTALDPSNGTLQYKTLSANTTFTESFVDGESITLMINDGTDYTVTWPTMTWASGSAPTLATSGYTTVVLWHRGGLYGAVVS